MDIYGLTTKQGIRVVGEVVTMDEDKVVLKNPIQMYYNPVHGIYEKHMLNGLLFSNKASFSYDDLLIHGFANDEVSSSYINIFEDSEKLFWSKTDEIEDKTLQYYNKYIN